MDQDVTQCAVRVCLRLRPTLRGEANGSPVAVDGNTAVAGDVTSTVDDIFDESTSQQAVYEIVGKGVLDAALDGKDATVIAYGETGSGKTFTMLGQESVSDAGLLSRIGHQLFARLSEIDDMECEVRMSYVELYDSSFLDLLQIGSTGLRVREHPVHGMYIDNLHCVLISSFDDFRRLLQEGNKVRAVAPTALAHDPSRSHVVCELRVLFRRKRTYQFRKAGSTGNTVVRTAVMRFVDLAGCETDCPSLSVLSEVVEGLSKGTTVDHTRSELTQLLQASLGGSAMATVIGCIHPCGTEAPRTLSFLSRVRGVVNPIATKKWEREQLLADIDQLQRELETMLEREEDSDTWRDSIDQLRGSLVGLMDRSCGVELGMAALLSDEKRSTLLLTHGVPVSPVVATAHPILIAMSKDSIMDGRLVHPILPGDTLIGSGEKCTITLIADRLHPVHLLLRNEAGQVTALHPDPDADPDDFPETYVNGEELDPEGVVLEDQDRIILGNVVFRFEFQGGREDRGLSPVTWDFTMKEYQEKNAILLDASQETEITCNAGREKPSLREGGGQVVKTEPSNEKVRLDLELKATIYNQKLLECEAELKRIGQRVETLWENQRWLPLVGWGRGFVRNDRPRYTNEAGEKYDFATVLPEGWRWVEDEWVLDGTGSGWLYAKSWDHPFHSSKQSLKDYVRKRMWKRTRVPIQWTTTPRWSPESSQTLHG